MLIGHRKDTGQWEVLVSHRPADVRPNGAWDRLLYVTDLEAAPARVIEFKAVVEPRWERVEASHDQG